MKTAEGSAQEVANETLMTSSQVVIGARNGANGEAYRGWLITREKDDDGAWHYTAVEGGEADESSPPPEQDGGPDPAQQDPPSAPESGPDDSDVAGAPDGDRATESESGVASTDRREDPANEEDLSEFYKAVREAMIERELTIERLVMLVEHRGPKARIKALRDLGPGIGPKTAKKTLEYLEDQHGLEPFVDPEADPALDIECPECGKAHGTLDPNERAYSDSDCPGCGVRFTAIRTESGDGVNYTWDTRFTAIRTESGDGVNYTWDTPDPQQDEKKLEPQSEPDTTGDVANHRVASGEASEEGEAAETPPPSEPASDSPPEIPPPKAAPNGIPVFGEPAQCVVVGRYKTHSPQWFKARAAGIGSSDVGAILGFSQFATIVDIWESKVDPQSEQRRMPWLDEYRDFGTWFEPYIIDAIEEQFDVLITRGTSVGTLQSLRNQILLANLDAWSESQVVNRNAVIEEIKTSESEWDVLPESHYAQVQDQMLVTGAELAHVRQFICPIPRALFSSLRAAFGELREFPFEDEADEALAKWLLREGKIVTWPVERDERFIAMMYERLEDFWECVTHGVQPEIVPPEGTVDLSDRDELVGAFDSFAQVDRDTKDFRGIIKRRDAHQKRVKGMIEREIALLGEPAKRVVVGEHKGTFVERADGVSYWSLYPAKGDE